MYLALLSPFLPTVSIHRYSYHYSCFTDEKTGAQRERLSNFPKVVYSLSQPVSRRKYDHWLHVMAVYGLGGLLNSLAEGKGEESKSKVPEV